jgi:hypothetical protein
MGFAGLGTNSPFLKYNASQTLIDARMLNGNGSWFATAEKVHGELDIGVRPASDLAESRSARHAKARAQSL